MHSCNQWRSLIHCIVNIDAMLDTIMSVNSEFPAIRHASLVLHIWSGPEGQLVVPDLGSQANFEICVLLLAHAVEG